MKVAFAIDWIICNFFLLFPWTLLLLVNNMLILKPTIASKIKLFLLFLFSSKLAVNFDLVSYLYIFRSIPNGFWSQSKKFVMLMLSVKRDLLNSVPRIKFKMFLQGFLCFKVLFIFSKKSIFNLNCVSAFWPWTYFRACYAKKCIQNQAWKISADFVCSKVLCGFFLKLNFEQNRITLK